MKKRQRKRKEYERRRRNKILRRKSRQKKNHYSMPQNANKYYRPKKKTRNLTAPSIFSIEKNPDELIAFFADAFDVIKECQKNDRIFFDLRLIVEATSDAIMFLIAIVNNTRRINILSITCSGNLPENADARRMFEAVGFYNYVSFRKKHIQNKSTERIRILHGTESNADVTATVCDFVCEKSAAPSKLLTKRLYPMLVELMTNTKQHAYKGEKGKMASNWYIYAENCPETVNFVFLDTGLGIPTTIRKNFFERVKDVFGGDKEDAAYIAAALEGEFRTGTKQENRGKGLPEIYAAVTNPTSRLVDLSIISGKGICKIQRDGRIEKKAISKAFEGTLFSWSFVKEVL